MTPPSGNTRRLHLPVPLVRQGNNCGCGLAAICMVMNYHGIPVTIHDLERHKLVLPRMLHRDGIEPNRLGRIALSYGCRVRITDPDVGDPWTMFRREGGEYVPEAPSKRHIAEALRSGLPVVACIPDKTFAFEECTHHGSHWITIRGMEGEEPVIHDPAPWRKAERCKPGYWDRWDCSMIVIQPPRGASTGATAAS